MLHDFDRVAVCAVFSLIDAQNRAAKHYHGPGNLRDDCHGFVLLDSVRKPQIATAGA